MSWLSNYTFFKSLSPLHCLIINIHTHIVEHGHTWVVRYLLGKFIIILRKYTVLRNSIDFLGNF